MCVCGLLLKSKMKYSLLVQNDRKEGMEAFAEKRQAEFKDN